MFAANLLNKLSSRYWDNVQKLRNGANNIQFNDDNYFDTTTSRDSKGIEIQNTAVLTPKPIMEDYIEQNYEDDEPQLLEKKLLVNRHKIPSYKPPPQPHHLPHHHPHLPHRHRYPYPHHVDLTLVYLSMFLVLGAILGVCLHGLNYNANNTTLVSNTSFAPNIIVSVNSTSDSDSSADTSSVVSINQTYPILVNGTLENITFIPIYGGGGWGWGFPFYGRGAGGTTGNIGRTFYETFDDVVEQFVNSFQSVEYE